MIISHKHKFIFMRPRKVAGTTIQNTLMEVCGDEDIDLDEGFMEKMKKIL